MTIDPIQLRNEAGHQGMTIAYRSARPRHNTFLSYLLLADHKENAQESCSEIYRAGFFLLFLPRTIFTTLSSHRSILAKFLRLLLRLLLAGTFARADAAATEASSWIRLLGASVRVLTSIRLLACAVATRRGSETGVISSSLACSWLIAKFAAVSGLGAGSGIDPGLAVGAVLAAEAGLLSS